MYTRRLARLERTEHDALGRKRHRGVPVCAGHECAAKYVGARVRRPKEDEILGKPSHTTANEASGQREGGGSVIFRTARVAHAIDVLEERVRVRVARLEAPGHRKDVLGGHSDAEDGEQCKRDDAHGEREMRTRRRSGSELNRRDREEVATGGANSRIS